jgi:hypothetical protein
VKVRQIDGLPGSLVSEKSVTGSPMLIVSFGGATTESGSPLFADVAGKLSVLVTVRSNRVCTPG